MSDGNGNGGSGDCPAGQDYYSCTFGVTVQYEGCCPFNACDFSGCPAWVSTDKRGSTYHGDITTGSFPAGAAATSSSQDSSDTSTDSSQPASTTATSTSPVDTPTQRSSILVSSTTLSTVPVSSSQAATVVAGQSSSQALASASPTPSGNATPSTSESHAGAIGGSVGGVAGLAFAAIIIWLLVRWLRARKSSHRHDEKHRYDEAMGLDENNADIIDNVIKKNRGSGKYIAYIQSL